MSKKAVETIKKSPPLFYSLSVNMLFIVPFVR